MQTGCCCGESASDNSLFPVIDAICTNGKKGHTERVTGDYSVVINDDLRECDL